MSAVFDRGDLAALHEAEEVEIETAASDAEPRHLAIIWVVVDDRDRVLIRSYRGPGARWYREAMARPACRLLLAGRAIEVRALRAADADRVAACSEGLRLKYAGHSAMPGMLRTYLDTTLELVPG
jgi:hypothetical protein